MKNILSICVLLNLACVVFAENVGSTNGEGTHLQLKRYRRWQIRSCPSNMNQDALNKKYRGWRCRCDMGYLYLRSKNDCYLPYRRGPCPLGHYVYYGVNSTTAQCVVNPCSEDGLVLYNGSCHKIDLWGEGPCGDHGGLITDLETLQPRCLNAIADFVTVAQQVKCSDGRVLETFGSNNASMWTCRCTQSGHYYFPSKNGCYQLYRQGPCPSGQYVYMAINETVPQCVVNPCQEDGLVPYQGSCQKIAIWGEDACEFGALIADPATLQLKCIGDITITHPSSIADLIKCPENLILHDSWMMDPRSWHCGCPWGGNHLYFPSFQSCYKPYTQGPCRPGYYVYRAINETVGQCVVNPCLEDGLVLYNGTCHKLGVSGGPACGAGNYLTFGHTLEIACSAPLHPSESHLIVAPDSECEPDIPNDPNSVCIH